MDADKKYTLEELKVKLTQKERIFCHQYIIDWNGARSAREAGYSEDSCRQLAHDTLTKQYIQQYIAFIKNNLEEESGISKLRNLKELAKIAYSNIAHLHNTWMTLNEFESLTDEQKACIESIDTKTVTSNFDDETKTIEYVKIKLYSKLQALESINKMLSYNSPEKTEVSGVGGEPLIFQWGNKILKI